MTPSIETKSAPASATRRSRRAATDETQALRYATAQSPLACVLVARSGNGIRAILLGDNAETLVEDLQARMPSAKLTDGDDQCSYIVATVAAHIDDRTSLSTSRSMRGALRSRRRSGRRCAPFRRA